MEWVEIIEPRTKEHMYANLTTGECVWDPPVGVTVKKTDDNQWWELYDQNTSRFYYYNAVSQQTVWHRPANCDIIPLAKLQTLKQNTEPPPEDDNEIQKPKDSVATQTPGKTVRLQKTVANQRLQGNKNAVSCETQTSPTHSPRTSRRTHSHHHSHSHSHGHRHAHHTQNQAVAPTSAKPLLKVNQSQDSGRSSDSSSRTSLEYHKDRDDRTGESPRHPLPTSTSTPLLDKKPLQELSQSQDKIATDQGSRKNASSHSIIGKPESNLSAAKQRSFDVETSLGIGGCYSNYGHHDNVRTTRTKHAVSSPSSAPPAKESHLVDLARSSSFVQRRDIQDEEDSMHEKYFMPGTQHGIRSIESTPQSRRKNPNFTKPNVRDAEGNFRKPHSFDSRVAEVRFNKHLDTDSESPSSSPITTSPSSPVSFSRKSKRSVDLKTPSYRQPSSQSDENKASANQEQDRLSRGPRPLLPPNKPVINSESFRKQRHELTDFKHKPWAFSDFPRQSSTKFDYKQSPQDGKENREIFRENGNQSGIKYYSIDRTGTQHYTNVDYSAYGQAHLPLQQYILEQAKLSGCYKLGDPLTDDLDSLDRSDEDDEEEEEAASGHRSRRASSRRGTRRDYDSDEFADDEGMSNQGDSSSQEYLDDPNYYGDEEEYTGGAGRGFPDYASEFKNHVEYIESLESRMAVNTVPQGVYYSGVPSGALFSKGSDGQKGSVPSSVQHASLKRKKELMATAFGYPINSNVDRSNECSNRPTSLPSHAVAQDIVDRPQSPRLTLTQDKKLPSESDIEKYAQGHLNIHKKGIFRKKESVRDMLSWSKDPIRKPMLVLADKALKKDACELFKLVQIYMSDRKAKVGMTLNSVALDICSLAYSKPLLRDELYVQICRQTTENPRRESLRRGWELLAICLNFFPPSAKFQNYLEGYMNRHRDPGFDFPEVVKWPIHVQISHYATVSCKRLERIGYNGKKPTRKPTIDEIDQARLQIFRASMFGNTLEEVMQLQKERFPNRKLPWVQTILSEEVLRLQGCQTEGIFRVSADVDEVNALKTKIDHWEVPTETVDAHAPASLLKLWYRELYEPLIPDSLYSECVNHHDDPGVALKIVDRLPSLNKLVLCYLVRFLQIFARTEVVQVTKMDASNLAMVMAPNCLRCTATDPRVIFDNARKEMSFMRTLIQHLDTSFMDQIS